MAAENQTLNVNVDDAEVAQFNRIAAQWWNPQGEMAPLHHINPVRLRYIARCAGGLKGKLALDIGCGGGLLSEAMAKEGAQVTGIDLATEALAAARHHAAETSTKVEYRSIAAEALASEAPGRYDLVTCLEMLEHVPSPESVVAACAKLTRPGGAVVFSTLNRNPKSFALAILGAEYLLNIVPRGTHEYAKFIRPSELERWATGAGLELVGLRGIRYNPILKSGSLSDDVDVNYLMHCRKPE